MADPLVVLCIHGVNTPEADDTWQVAWRKVIEEGVRRWSPGREVKTTFLAYNALFAAWEPSALDYVEALGRMLASGISSLFGGRVGRARDFAGVSQTVRWTAGMVVQWVDNANLRAEARNKVVSAIQEHDPHLIVAHSMGSLLCYDTFCRAPGRDAVKDRTFISLGSQIGNPFVRNIFGGRLQGVPARFWYHLYNRHDGETFTWPIRLAGADFAQIETDFDVSGMIDHDPVLYLGHAATRDTMWREIAGPQRARAVGAGVGPEAGAGAEAEPVQRASAAARPRVEKRALVVGINDYPVPGDRLEGCLNDAFLMSAVLQECGFSADDIRLVLDQRATARGILDRLEWLLDGTRPGDQRVLFYSGHGAQLPSYAPDERVDHKDECLVPFDFDWSIERAITDNQIFDLYSQLPYGSNVVLIFDCCHSGGLAREGGARIRGLSPPDDIRHRDLRWDEKHEMWVSRDLPPVNRSLSAEDRKAYVGRSGATARLGRAHWLRRLENDQYDAVRRELDHHGPYMPVIVEACAEGQLAQEYRHGVASYGAFTYCAAKILRAHRRDGDNLTYDELVKHTGGELRELRYDQTPQVVGPAASRTALLPWIEGGKAARKSATRTRRR